MSKILNYELREYGFIPLSAEGCGLGMRRLYDLTPQAVRIVEAFLSIKIEQGNNWNSSDGQVASIMLPGSIMDQLSAFCLLYVEKYDIAVVVNFRSDSHSAHFVEGFFRERWKEELERYNLIFPNGWILYQGTGDADGGTRNQHFFSGRVR